MQKIEQLVRPAKAPPTMAFSALVRLVLACMGKEAVLPASLKEILK
jgi:hypothetical protein